MQPNSSAYEAIHRALDVTKRFAEDEGSLVLNVVMEIRFTKNSNSPLSPAYGHEVGYWYNQSIWAHVREWMHRRAAVCSSTS